MAKIRNGESYLKTHLSANDYYSEKESVGGIWVGHGAQFLGIEGNTISSKDEAFERLRRNEHPVTGLKLTKRNKTTRLPTFEEARKSLCQQLRLKGESKEGVKGNLSGGSNGEGVMPSKEDIEAHRKSMKPLCNRVAFFDFQCGCAKSVSIMAIVGNDERLRTAHEEAVLVGLQELESLAARRVDVMGKKQLQFTGNITAALFHHDASRALDPQLHTHCVVANATFDEGRQEWIALSEFEMLKAIRYVGKVYQNELARRVKALGYEIVERRNERGVVEGFEIDGVPQDVMKLYSKRRAVVEHEIALFKEKVGRLPSPAEIAVLTKESRTSKNLTEITTQEVRKKQKAELSVSEFYTLSFLRDMSLKRQASIKSEVIDENSASRKENVAISHASEHLLERASTLSSHQILAEALNQKLGYLELEELKKELISMKSSGSDLVEVVSDPHPLSSIFTSRQHLEHEEWAVSFVDAFAGKKEKLLDKEPVTSSWLAKEQAEAVKFVCGMEDALCAVRGIAGAGKTTMLKELHKHLEEARHQMLYLAPTASAVDVLKSEGFVNATTVSDYLVRAQSGLEVWDKAVVVIDESGLKSTKQGYEMLKLAHKHWQRLVLVGDSKQHVSVEAGDFLRLLETHSKMRSNELKEIRRQVPEEYREAIGLMAQGRAAEALEKFDKMGWMNEGGAHYLENAAHDYLSRSEYGRKSDEVIAVTPTWEENFTFTEEIRKGLKEYHVLKEGVMREVFHSLQWTKVQKEQVENYSEGYVVVPNRKFGGLEKGISYVVEKVVAGKEKNGGKVLLSGGRELSTVSLLKQAKYFDVGLRREIEVSEGDKILLRANDKGHGLINGKVVTVDRLEGDGDIVTREGISIPAQYRQLSHGYVVTSQRSQGMTASHVVVAAAKLDEKAAYVATSRGKMSCDLHTPDKEFLINRVRNPTIRVGVLDAQKLHPSHEVKMKERSNGQHFKEESAGNIRKEGFFVASTASSSHELPSPVWSLRKETIFKLRSMNPSRNQSVRVNAFGSKLSRKVARVIDVAKKVREHILPITMRQNRMQKIEPNMEQNITQKSPSPSFRI